MSCSEPITINRHSGATITLNWLNTDGSSANLTGWAISVVDKSTAIDSQGFLKTKVVTRQSWLAHHVVAGPADTRRFVIS